MARKQPYLKRRGNRFHHRQRVPQDIAHRFQRDELNIALGTGDVALAAQRSRLLSAMADKLFDRVRQDKSLTADDIAKLAREHLRLNLEGDEQRRARGGRTDPYEETAQLKLLAGLGYDALQFGDLRSVEPIADTMLKTYGLMAEKGSPEYGELCRAIIRADIERFGIGIARARGDYSVVPSDPLFGPSRGASGGYGDVLTAPRDQGPLLSEIFKKWEGERKPSRKTLEEWEATFTLFYEIIGDKPIRAVTRDDIRVFKDTLLKLPARRTKKFPGMSVAEAIERAKSDTSIATISPASVNKYLTSISSVLSYGCRLMVDEAITVALTGQEFLPASWIARLYVQPSAFVRHIERIAFELGRDRGEVYRDLQALAIVARDIVIDLAASLAVPQHYDEEFWAFLTCEQSEDMTPEIAAAFLGGHHAAPFRRLCDAFMARKAGN